MPILGANGSGKTSLLRTISGLLAPSKGAIRFFGHAPRSYSAPAIAAMKVAHVPEGRGTIGGLTVEENLWAGAYLRAAGDAVRADIERCYGYFPILRAYRKRAAKPQRRRAADAGIVSCLDDATPSAAARRTLVWLGA